MSVIVKDMRFPNYCSDCEFSKPWGNSGTYCSRHPERDAVHYGEEKPDWCPLSNIPTPHGRLIDADALIEDLERQCKEVFRIGAVSPDDYWITRNEAYNEALWKSWVESFGEYLKTRPTIIEAEVET